MVKNGCECDSKLLDLGFVDLHKLFFLYGWRYNWVVMKKIIDGLVKFMTSSQISACGFFIKVHELKMKLLSAIIIFVILSVCGFLYFYLYFFQKPSHLFLYFICIKRIVFLFKCTHQKIKLKYDFIRIRLNDKYKK